MSVISLNVSATNPVKREHLDEALRLINPKVSLTLPEKDVADHLAILSGSHEAFQKIIDLPDYVPTVDKVRFPRKNVHAPGVDVNESNAWAWLADVMDVDPKGALKGVTVVLKGQHPALCFEISSDQTISLWRMCPAQSGPLTSRTGNRSWMRRW